MLHSTNIGGGRASLERRGWKLERRVYNRAPLDLSRRRPMTRMLCAALLLLSGLASVAHAAGEASSMPAPTESAMPAPAESAPPAPGAAGPVVPAGELAEETPPQRQAALPDR